MEWLTPTEHDFGDIKQGVPVKAKFRFKNTGTEPLTVDNVRSTCGCTASEWRDDFVAPGEESIIEVEYDAKRAGYFRRKVTVFFSGMRGGEKLWVEGFVE
jgi:hypothetical protein